MIADGSELLLLIKALRNVVGSVVLPVLGAVPDGAIVLFSGLGENAQEEVAIGVGALAGSTIMLLTIPWFLSVMAGRVNIRADGTAMYSAKPRLWPPNNYHLTRTGVRPKGMVRVAGKYMMLTAISYIVIQGMALRTGTFFAANQTEKSTRIAAAKEHNAALFVLFVCSALFVYYLYSQFTVTPEKRDYRGAVVTGVTLQALQDRTISLTAAFDELWTFATPVDEESPLVENGEKTKRLNKVLRIFFKEYDKDDSGTIDAMELEHLMTDLGERLTERELQNLLARMDTDESGTISFDEFTHAMREFIQKRASQSPSRSADMASVPTPGLHEDSDEEEVPEDLKHPDPRTERLRILIRSFSMMAVGTILVLIFSDPMVGVMNEVGKRMGVPAFYISFALAPLASNASEVIAAYSYAQKKTRRTVTISMSTLLGAAILNNTFVLGIFMLLIAVKGLAWQFTAETISILFVEAALGYMSQKKVHRLRDGIFVLLLYPTSIFIVAFLENVVGLD